MPASPDQVRAGLRVVTAAAVADTRSVAAAASSPAQVRAALFAAVPLIVEQYASGSAALALDWYEELRDAASPAHVFTPTPLVLVRDDDVAASVAVSTEPLYELERGTSDEPLARAVERSLVALAPDVQRSVASGFRTTVVGNAETDPDARGWRRYTRLGACKLCLMLADRGAVYTRSTARFAAHTDCECVAGPVYDPGAPRADVMQYVASSKHRTAKQQAALRDYLNKNYPDAPG